jgi:hypothetical protein
MERVIHQFSVPDGSEIRLVVDDGGDAPRMELRRYRTEGGALVIHERFPFRLSWIPNLVEGLVQAEETLQAGTQPAGDQQGGGTGRLAPFFDGAALSISPQQLKELEAAGAEIVDEPALSDPSIRVSGRFPRFSIRAPLIVAVQSKELAGPRILTGDAVDISWGGLQAQLPTKLTPGTVLEILLGLGGKKALKLPARVVWGRNPEGIGQSRPHGIEFLPADPRLRQLVEQYIFGLAQGEP